MPSRSIVLVLAAAAAWLASPPSLAAGGKTDAAAAAAPAASQAKASPAPAKIDINSASRAQLKTLPGIGDAEADRIIAARPYPSKAKLGAEKIVSDETYLAIKGLIVAAQPPEPKSKTASKAPSKP
jgi:DNA uptake protein ComE-like DNA-binding protein